MAFVVEDGTGLATATAYISIAFADAYFLDRGNDAWADAETTEKQIAIILATDYVDLTRNYRGFKTFPNVQALEWPRDGVLTRTEQTVIDPNSIPTKIEKATAEIAVFALTEEILPNVSKASAEVLSESKGARGLSISRTFKQQVNSNPILRKALCYLQELQASSELYRS